MDASNGDAPCMPLMGAKYSFVMSVYFEATFL